jgi:hypothetical protein
VTATQRWVRALHDAPVPELELDMPTPELSSPRRNEKLPTVLGMSGAGRVSVTVEEAPLALSVTVVGSWAGELLGQPGGGWVRKRLGIDSAAVAWPGCR